MSLPRGHQGDCAGLTHCPSPCCRHSLLLPPMARQSTAARQRQGRQSSQCPDDERQPRGNRQELWLRAELLRSLTHFRQLVYSSGQLCVANTQYCGLCSHGDTGMADLYSMKLTCHCTAHGYVMQYGCVLTLAALPHHSAAIRESLAIQIRACVRNE